MRLEMATTTVSDVKLSDRTRVERGVLEIAEAELRRLLLDDEAFADVTLAIARPGESARIIHAMDAGSAVTAGLRRQLPARVALVAAGISLTNTALAAIIARPERTCEPAAKPSADRAQPDGSPVPATASADGAERARYGQ